MSRHTAGWLSVAVVAFVMGACGGEDAPGADAPSLSVDPSQTAREAIAGNVNGFWDAAVLGDGEAACSYLTARGQRLMERVVSREWEGSTEGVVGCAPAVELFSDRLAEDERRDAFPSAHTYSPEDVYIDDEDPATAQVSCEFRGAIFMTREPDGAWRIDLPACVD